VDAIWTRLPLLSPHVTVSLMTASCSWMLVWLIPACPRLASGLPDVDPLCESQSDSSPTLPSTAHPDSHHISPSKLGRRLSWAAHASSDDDRPPIHSRSFRPFLSQWLNSIGVFYNFPLSRPTLQRSTAVFKTSWLTQGEASLQPGD